MYKSIGKSTYYVAPSNDILEDAKLWKQWEKINGFRVRKRKGKLTEHRGFLG